MFVTAFNRSFCFVTLFCVVVVAYICSFSHAAFAQVVTNTNANIAFGLIDFSNSHNGRVQLGTNGNVNATGFGLAPRDDGNAGRVRITSPDSGILEVKCSTEGLLVDPDAPDLDIENIEIAVNVGVAFGSATQCLGVLPADPITMMLDMDLLGDPDILIGGDVPINNIATFPSDREFSTGGGGSAIRLSITVQ